MPECPIFFVYLISSSLTYWQRKVYGWHLEGRILISVISKTSDADEMLMRCEWLTSASGGVELALQCRDACQDMPECEFSALPFFTHLGNSRLLLVEMKAIRSAVQEEKGNLPAQNTTLETNNNNTEQAWQTPVQALKVASA
ncbi:hypothetical protein ZEAMMB73_Zm00001d048652 [Zea mays]|uniref:Uncharacterized protein n=1 Tax=Zea mays TaxID=4577 RepID=A0A1D6PN99_MAIZE|nr:hypothetical protein ZEAMMB73_Zm00001d048652 [Zea mays]